MNIQLATIRTYVMMARATKQKHYLDKAKLLLAEYKADATITFIYRRAA